MNLRQLAYFVKVVEVGNMTRAAEQLHLAQPALGMQIRQLEEELGVALIVRHSRGIEPTKAGILLQERATSILRLVDETRRLVKASEDAGMEELRFGLTPSLMLMIGSDIAINVREQLSQVRLTLVEDMSHILIDGIATDRIDAALAYDVPDIPHMSRLAVYQEDLVLVTLPSNRNGEPIMLCDVVEERLALPDIGDNIRTHVATAAKEQGLDFKMAYEVRSITAIKNLVLRGAAVGILPYGTVLTEVRSGKLDVRPITAPTIRRTLFLAFTRRRGAFRCELALTGVIRASLATLAKELGALGHPLLPPEA